jgi:hypothetical protein
MIFGSVIDATPLRVRGPSVDFGWDLINDASMTTTSIQEQLEGQIRRPDQKVWPAIIAR